MNKFKITVMKITTYPELSQRYENPIDSPCAMREGDTFFTDGQKPNGMCDSAWETILPFLGRLSRGERVYGDWMKNGASAMLSCNDGFRPVSFLIEKL